MPTQNIMLLLNIWLWMKFSTLQRRSKFQTKHECLGTKIHELCNKTGYTYGMEVYSGQNTSDCRYNNIHHSKVLDRKGRRTWAQAVHEQFLFLSWQNRKSTVAEMYDLREREYHFNWY
jgi:hypothetical protein